MARPPPRVHHAVRFNRLSLVMSCIAILNLAAVPLKVYISTTFPWNLSTVQPFEYDVFNSSALLASFHALAHSSAKPLVRNEWAFVFSHSVRLPSEGAADCAAYTLSFPAVIFYGQALRDFTCGFATHDATARLPLIQVSPPTNATSVCQEVYVFGSRIIQSCLWFESDNTASNADNTANNAENKAGNATTRLDQLDYVAYFGATTWEPLMYCWAKFGVRVTVSIAIVALIWREYYRHYRTLVHNLTTLGFPDLPTAPTASPPGASQPPMTFEIQVGDPTYLVLGNSAVSMILAVLFYLDVVYVGLASVRTSQLADFAQFGLGCLYCSALMWYGYAALRYTTYIVKRLGIEHWVEPVDPGTLAAAATIYAGPLFFTLANTVSVYPIQYFLSASSGPNAIDVAPLCVIVALLHCTVPLLYAFGRQWCRHRRDDVIVQPTECTETRMMRPAPHDFSSETYNDVKLRCFAYAALALRQSSFLLPFSSAPPVRFTQLPTPSSETPGPSSSAVPRATRLEGGTAYTLHPRFNRLPLLSHRAADCFVSCIDAATGDVVKKVRLSLLSCLDRHERDSSGGASREASDKLGQRQLRFCTSCNTRPPQPVCTLDRHPSPAGDGGAFGGNGESWPNTKEAMAMTSANSFPISTKR